MTEEKQNIAIYKLLGYKPRRMWRYWYNKKRDYGSICNRTKEEALEIIKEEKTRWPFTDYPEEYEFSEPEEYDDWYDLPSVDLDLIQKVKESLTFNQQTEYVASLMRLFKDFPMTNAFLAGEKEQKEALLRALNLWED